MYPNLFMPSFETVLKFIKTSSLLPHPVSNDFGAVRGIGQAGDLGRVRVEVAAVDCRGGRAVGMRAAVKMRAVGMPTVATMRPGGVDKIVLS
jgi:hypothetical protein